MVYVVDIRDSAHASEFLAEVVLRVAEPRGGGIEGDSVFPFVLCPVDYPAQLVGAAGRSDIRASAVERRYKVKRG